MFISSNINIQFLWQLGKNNNRISFIALYNSVGSNTLMHEGSTRVWTCFFFHRYHWHTDKIPDSHREGDRDREERERELINNKDYRTIERN